MKRTLLLLTIAVVLILAALFTVRYFADAKSAMQDGYYTATMSEYSYGWKEYVTICVKGGGIASVEYNAVNASGFVKAWDMAYMRNMSAQGGMYPNLYTRQYAKLLMEKQSSEDIDSISGATVSGNNFRLLADAVIQMSIRGDDDVVVVEMPDTANQSPDKQSTVEPEQVATEQATVQPQATVDQAIEEQPTEPAETVEPAEATGSTETTEPAETTDATSSATVSDGN